MPDAKKQWRKPSIERIALSKDRLAQLFPQLSAEQRDRIAEKSSDGP